jgi:hypothetical protein
MKKLLQWFAREPEPEYPKRLRVRICLKDGREEILEFVSRTHPGGKNYSATDQFSSYIRRWKEHPVVWQDSKLARYNELDNLEFI